MPLDHLLSALEREATAEAERLLADARATVAQLDAAAAGEAGRRRDAELAARRETLRGAMERRLAAARRAARFETLSARDRLLARVFAAVERELAPAARSEDYAALLEADLAAALAAVGEAGAVVRASPETAPALRRLARGRDGLQIQVDAGGGPGFRVESADRSVVVDQTLAQRVARRRTALAREALRLLGVET